MSDDLLRQLRSRDQLATDAPVPDLAAQVVGGAWRRGRRRRLLAGSGAAAACIAVAVVLLSVRGGGGQAHLAPAAAPSGAPLPAYVLLAYAPDPRSTEKRPEDALWGADGSLSFRPHGATGPAEQTKHFLSADELAALPTEPAALPAALAHAGAGKDAAAHDGDFVTDAVAVLLDPYTPAPQRAATVAALLARPGTTASGSPAARTIRASSGAGFVLLELSADQRLLSSSFEHDGSTQLQVKVLGRQPLDVAPFEASSTVVLPDSAAVKPVPTATPRPLPSGTDGCPQQVPVRRTPLDVVTVLDCRVTLVGRDLVRQHRHATAAEASALLAALRRPDVSVPLPSDTACPLSSPPPEPALTLVLSDGSRVTPRWTKGICSRLQGLEEYGATAFTVDSSEVLVREVAGPAVSPTP